MIKSNISDVYFHKYLKIKINSAYDLLSEITLNMENVVKFIKSVFNKNSNHYYYQMFIEKRSYKNI